MADFDVEGADKKDKKDGVGAPDKDGKNGIAAKKVGLDCFACILCLRSPHSDLLCARCCQKLDLFTLRKAI